VLLSSALVLLGVLGTLAWAQDGAPAPGPRGLELEEELATEA